MTKKMKKIKQHYVPRFYLKKFARITKSGFRIRCFDKKNLKTFESNISQVAMEKYFYDKGVPPEIENLFSKKENEHSKVYFKIIGQQSILNLTKKEKFLMAEYLYLQNERTKSARELYAQVFKRMYKYFEENKNYPEYEKFSEDYKKWLEESRAKKAQLNIMFEDFKDDDGTVHKPEDVLKEILNLGWILAKNNLNFELYTSDHPVMVYVPNLDGEIGPKFGAFQYFSKGVEIFFPLTPKHCLILFDRAVSEYNQFNNEKTLIKGELDWINTQIIAQAYRMIFTKKNDFEFVKNVLKKYPELRDPNRNRIYG